MHLQSTRCRRAGGILASPDDQSSSTSLRLFPLLYGVERSWLGLHDLVEEGKYQTMSLRSLDFSSWAKSQPHTTAGFDCVSVGPHGWESKCCYESLPAICESRCKRGYSEHSGTCFKFQDVSRSWQAQEKECRKDGASLAPVNSAGDLRALQSFLVSGGHSHERVYFGLHDLIEEGQFMSPSLDSLTFFSWIGGRTPSASSDDCGVLNRFGMYMGCCYRKRPAVCSMPARQVG
ncbi:regenerating islet-derived protein 3-gamma-like isoform X2 [Diadema setosum]|uniref:regenerating islet-derived protein 3-gamma-like isoform X2 n=1 Tax=Diadema setosum TaxID=31175 RepID=UPI003B3A68BB